MNISELFIFLLCCCIACIFLLRWYGFTFSSLPSERSKNAKRIFGILPLVVAAMITYTLEGLASFDVINNPFWTFFYIVIGFAWVYGGLTAMSLCFDLSWIDDALNLNNKAALIAITGGLIGITTIYSGANIGDGPGWWCVFLAGGLGMISWFALGIIINITAKVFYHITVERDIYCGIRVGSYFLASGIILGRASAGDWTSFEMTVIEFYDGWPVVILTAIMIAVELYGVNQFINNTGKPKFNSFSRSDAAAAAAVPTTDKMLRISIIIGILYVVLAVASVILLPSLPHNPIYGR